MPHGDRPTDTRAFTGGPVLPMAPAARPPEVVVVAGDTIAAVGDRALLDRFPEARVHDLGGKTLCPGFVDAHHHLSIAAVHPRFADARGASDMAELGRRLTAQAARDPDSPWIRAVGWDDAPAGFTARRADLDALGLERPVLVAHYSLHEGVCDSKGLDLLGIGRTTPDPVGGRIGREPDGAPDGLLVERAWSEAHRRSLAPYDDPERLAEHIETAARALLADGITAVHDTACSPAAEAAYRTLARADRLAVSVLACPHPAALLGPPEGDRLGGPVTGEGDERLRVGPMKLFADGGIIPAIDAHLGGQRVTVGDVFPDLRSHAVAAAAAGFQIAVHAIGNVGLEAALEAFEAVAASDDTDHRFRVEHACLASADQLRRLAVVGGVAVVQPAFLEHLGRHVEDVDFDDATWLPFATAEACGVALAASSDCPCTFHQPLLGAALGTTRRTGSGAVLGAGESVSFLRWLEAYTAGAAYAGGQEAERGALVPGLRADLVVLEGDLDAERPPVVAETWVGGRLAFRSDMSASRRR